MAETIWFVSRHMGAVEWARGRGIEVDHLVAHLDPEDVGMGDTVIGSLPVHLVAEICARGARYLHLSLDLPPELRGRELSSDDMNVCNARLEEYEVREIPSQ